MRVGPLCAVWLYDHHVVAKELVIEDNGRRAALDRAHDGTSRTVEVQSRMTNTADLRIYAIDQTPGVVGFIASTFKGCKILV